MSVHWVCSVIVLSRNNTVYADYIVIFTLVLHWICQLCSSCFYSLSFLCVRAFSWSEVFSLCWLLCWLTLVLHWICLLCSSCFYSLSFLCVRAFSWSEVFSLCWNTLSYKMRSHETLSSFKPSLRTHLFQLSYRLCVCVCMCRHACMRVCVRAHVCVALLLTRFTVPGLYSVSVWAIFITLIPCLFIYLQVTEIVQKKIMLIPLLLNQWCETWQPAFKIKIPSCCLSCLNKQKSVSYCIFKSQVYTVLCITPLYSTAMLIPTLLRQPCLVQHHHRNPGWV